MEYHKKKPSGLAMAFFHWFCHPQFREEIEGDLMERFHSYSQTYGYTKANRLFIKDVLLLFRPAIIGNLYQLTNTEAMVISKQNRRHFTILTVTAAILLVPLIAMLFTSEVNWKIIDFIIAGVLLIGTGLTLDFVIRKIGNRTLKTILAVMIILVLLMIWAELAVGIFGSVFAGS